MENFSLDVNEENYSKYFLGQNTSGEQVENVDDNDDDDDDDEFGSIDDDYEQDEEEEEDDDNKSNVTGGSEAKNLANDTSKNNHFFVWRLKSNKTRTNSNLQQKQTNTNGSENDDLSCLSSDDLYTSSEDEDDFDNRNDNEDDQDDLQEREQEQEHDHDHDSQLFFNEVILILKRSLRENLDPNNSILEINSCKHANNIQIDDLCYYFAKALFYLPISLAELNPKKAISEQTETVQKFNYLTSFKEYILKNKQPLEIIKNYYTKTKQSQRMFLNSLQDFFIETKLYLDQQDKAFLDSFYVKTIHFLYDDCDFLSDALILEWYQQQNEKLEASKNSKQVLIQNIELKRYSLNKLKPFIEWLQEDDDEDDDDEEEED